MSAQDQNEVVYLVVRGKVQHAVFRQAIMRAAIKRNVIAGATNDESDQDRVEISLQGPKDKVQEIIDGLKSGKPLNSFGAMCTSVEIVNSGKKPLEHESNTAKYDMTRPTGSCEFYL